MQNRRPGPILQGFGHLGQNLEPTDSPYGLVDAGDDLVLVLMKLTTDVERFDSMVALQRDLLQHGGAYDNDELDGQWRRLRFEAAELVGRARQALEQLQRLSDAASRVPHEPRHGVHDLTEDSQPG